MAAEAGRVTVPVQLKAERLAEAEVMPGIENGIAKVAEALGITEPNGGYRVALKEVLLAIWQGGYDQGSVDQAWTAQGTPPEGSSLASDTVAGVGRARTDARLTESHGDAVSALRGWWEQTAHDEVAQLTAKMTEYGGLSRATDLTAIGQDLVAAGVAMGHQGDDFEARLQELGIYFYVRGKFARWQAAIIEGRPVSDDTLLDIGIYVRMAQRLRAVGGWPV